MCDEINGYEKFSTQLFFILSQILTKYVAIEPRVSVSMCVCVCVCVFVCVCAHTDWSFIFKMSNFWHVFASVQPIKIIFFLKNAPDMV